MSIHRPTPGKGAGMRKLLRQLTALAMGVAGLAMFTASAPALASGTWGANYFPNVALTTHEGETVKFFDDLIEDRIVLVNFIYTTCADTCPLETAQLTKVQRILGDRLGDDIHFYSITIDPDHDTPEVLADYRDKFSARWTFLTGNEKDIVLLRRKLGLYIDEIQDGSNNHNVNMIIGNQSTGRWMKRSPFENPYVLADQLGSWLTGWKGPAQSRDYAQAPQIRKISDGEKLFRTRCSICHSIGGSDDPDLVGPDLLGVTQRREHGWLVRWLRAPDKMLAEGDPLALALFEQYNEVPMPNMRLSEVDVTALLKYMHRETDRLLPAAPGVQVVNTPAAEAASPQSGGVSSNAQPDIVAVANAWVREPIKGATADVGYLTMINLSGEDQEIVGVHSPAFRKVEIHEMKVVNDLPRMRRVDPLRLPAGEPVNLAPGGKHLMLMGAHRPLVAEQTVEVVLQFANGATQTVRAPVKAVN